MNGMKKKLLALILTLAMCLSLGACMQTEPAAENAVPAENAATENAAPAEGADAENAAQAEDTAAEMPGAAGAGTENAAAVVPAAHGTTGTDSDHDGAASGDKETRPKNDFAVATRGTAWVDSDLAFTVSGGKKIRLQDDFAAAANGQWIAEAVIADGQSSVSSISERCDEIDEQMKSLLTDTTLTSHDAQLVQSLYSVVTDWDMRNALGVQPAATVMNAIENITSLDQMTEFLAGDAMNLGLGIFSVSTTVDLDIPTDYTVGIDSTALCLGDSDEYGDGGMTELGQLDYTFYHDISVYLLQRLGYTEEEAEKTLKRCLEFETLCAAYELPRAAQYEADFYDRINNSYDRAGLEKLAGDFPLLPMLDACGYGVSNKYLLYEPEWLAAMGNIYTEKNLELIKDYLKIHFASGVCSKLDREAYDKNVEIANAANGVTGTQDDETAAYNAVSGMLAGPMDNLYIEKFCSEKTRADVTEMINEVIAQYRIMLDEEDWLSEEMRASAIEKLDSMRVHAAYPDELGDSYGLTIASASDGGTYLDAAIAVAKFDRENNISYINKQVDPDAWYALASDVNAYYNFQDNSITILNGILGGAFYDENASREEKLGSIGIVIGHEISHAFDTYGSQFDKDGVLRNWWTDADRAAFNERTAKLVKYYDGIVPYEGAGNYSGAQVQSEAIADMGGMKCMLAIAANDPDFDYDLFFRSYAAIWRMQCSKEYELQLAKTDVHPLAYLRINVTLQQFEEFYETYDIQPGDGMYLAPEERIAVW